MANVFSKALWDQRRGIFGWSVGVAAVGVMYAFFYPTMNTPALADFMRYFPQELFTAMGISDFKKVYTSNDLASGQSIIFAATGVTDGTLMKAVRFFGDGIRTSSLVMQNRPHQIRFIDTIHVRGDVDVKIRF